MTGWALITGATSATGQAIALNLAKHGWDIIVHYHRSTEQAQSLAKQIQALGRDACLVELDLSNASLAATIIPSLAEETGMIDALINNAAMREPDGSDPDGSRHIAVNADAARILAKAFRDHIPPKEKGAIVNLLDATPEHPGFSAYKRSKDMLAEMTRNMAKSFAPQTRVNGVAIAHDLSINAQNGEYLLTVAESVRRFVETTAITGEVKTIV